MRTREQAVAEARAEAKAQEQRKWGCISMSVFLEMAGNVRQRLPHLKEDASQRHTVCPRMPCFADASRPLLALLHMPWCLMSPQKDADLELWYSHNKTDLAVWYGPPGAELRERGVTYESWMRNLEDVLADEDFMT